MRVVRHEELVAAACHQHHGHGETVLVVEGVDNVSHQLRACLPSHVTCCRHTSRVAVTRHCHQLLAWVVQLSREIQRVVVAEGEGPAPQRPAQSLSRLAVAVAVAV